MVEIVQLTDIDKIWPQVTQGMQTACLRSKSDLTAGVLWQMCRSGHAFLFIVHDGSSIYSAQVWRFEGAQFRCVMMYGHRMRSWLPMMRDFITRIAKENGAVVLTAQGRSGWSRVFGVEKTGLDYEVNI